MDVHLQLISFWCEPKHRHGDTTVKYTDVELKFGVEVVEDHPQHILLSILCDVLT